MKDSEWSGDADAFAARMSAIEKQCDKLDDKIAVIEERVDYISKMLTEMQSIVGLDLMLAKIIIDR